MWRRIRLGSEYMTTTPLKVGDGWVQVFDALPGRLRDIKTTYAERGVHYGCTWPEVVQLDKSGAFGFICAVVAVTAGDVVWQHLDRLLCCCVTLKFQHAPDFLVVVWTQHLACNSALGCLLNSEAMPDRDRAQVFYKLINHRRRNAQYSSHFSLRTNDVTRLFYEVFLCFHAVNVAPLHGIIKPCYTFI